jgi:hypothetical protein
MRHPRAEIGSSLENKPHVRTGHEVAHLVFGTIRTKRHDNGHARVFDRVKGVDEERPTKRDRPIWSKV